MRRSLPLVILGIFWAGAAAQAEDLDLVRPQVVLHKPIPGVYMGIVELSGTASDNRGVSKVRFSVDNVVITTVTAPPYAHLWDSNLVTDGTHTLTATAFDLTGLTAEHSVLVTVKNIDTSSPTAVLVHPAPGSAVAGLVEISAQASDDRGLAKVEFLVDGLVRSIRESPPFTYSWNTAKEINSSFQLGVRAVDTSGNRTLQSITVLVDNSPPSLLFSKPAPGAAVSGRTEVLVQVSDGSGLRRLEFRVDGALRKVTSSGPYSYDWDTARETNGSHAVSIMGVDRAGNVARHSLTVNVSNPVPAQTVVGKTVSGQGSVVLRGGAVPVQIQFDPGLSVKLQHTDLGGTHYSYSVAMLEERQGAYAGAVDTRLLSPGAGVIKFRYAVTLAGAEEIFDGGSLALEEAVLVSSAPGNRFVVPDGNESDGELAVVLPSGEGTGLVEFKRVDTGGTGSSFFQAASEPGVDLHHGSPVCVYEVKVENRENTVLARPALLTLLYSDADNDGIVDGTAYPEVNLKVFWRDPARGRWQLIGGLVDTRKNTVTAQVLHFSTYGLLPAAPVAGAEGAKSRETHLSPGLVDGVNDVAAFGLEAEQVSIFDVQGNEVFRSHQQDTAGSVIVWTGRDDAGRLVDSGPYIARLRLKQGGTIHQLITIVK